MKLTDIIGLTLKKHGIETVFGLQGGAVVHIFDSIEKYGIKTVYTLHEQTASLACVSNSKSTNIFGCAVVTTGPAATNAITGLLAAWTDSTPCLFISGQVRSAHMSYGRKVRQIGTQEAPICDIVRPITKHSIFIEKPENFQIELEQAIQIACSGRPGPVWIDIPVDFQWLDIPFDNQNDFKLKRSQTKLNNLAKFKDLFSKSAKPLFVLGNGIRACRSEDLCREFFQITKIPFVTTWTSQDLFPTDSK